MSWLTLFAILVYLDLRDCRRTLERAFPEPAPKSRKPAYEGDWVPCAKGNGPMPHMIYNPGGCRYVRNASEI